MTGPVVSADGVRLSYPDPARRLQGVSLHQEVAWPRPGPELSYAEGSWSAYLPRPAVDRMEYLFELLHPGGGPELTTDPANPLRAPGPFGAKSVIEFPGYRPPDWLAGPPVPPGRRRPLELGPVAQGALWSAAGTPDDEPLPLLVVHDGFEYAEYSALERFLDRGVQEGRLPPMRALLLHPADRDEQYSASPAYADALTELVLPRAHAAAPVRPGRRYRVGMGASLGALAMLHAHRLRPASFGGLFLQSGSFFHHRYFPARLSFAHFERIRWFLDRVHAAGNWDLPVPVALTCGEVEQNFPNNRATAHALRAQGYPVSFVPVRDGHTWVGWRDAFTPALEELLRGLWR